MKTWIRVEDEFAQFDHPKGAPLPKGVTKVKDYPEHVSQWARDPKRKSRKGGPQKRTETSAPASDKAERKAEK